MNLLTDRLDQTRRHALLAIGSGFLMGCSSTSTFNLVKEVIVARHGPQGRYPMTDEQLHALPYATLGVRVGAGNRSVMVLSRAEMGDLYWVSADHVLFVTRNGRLVKTHGLKRDLASTTWTSADPLDSGARTDDEIATSRSIEFGGADAERVEVVSSFQNMGEETVATLNGDQDAVRFEERVLVPDWRWETKNTFWVKSASGVVLKSRQQFCPEIAPIELEVLKPYKMVS